MIVKLHLRMDLDVLHTQIEDYIKLESEKYIISREETPKIHYHVYYELDLDYTLTPYKKRKLGEKISEHFNLVGNKSYSLSLDRGKTEIYILKEGNFIYSGYTEEDIFNLQEKSFKPTDFKGAQQALREKYIKKKILYTPVSEKLHLQEFSKEVTQLYLTFSKNIYPQHIKAFLLGAMLTRNPSEAAKYAEDFCPAFKTMKNKS